MENPSDRSSPRGQRGISDLLIRVVLMSTLVSSVAGAAYGHFAHDALVTGAVVGAAFGAVLSTLEGLVFHGEPGAGLRRAPFLVNLGVRVAAYVVLIVAMMALVVRLMNGPGSLSGLGPADVGFTLAGSVLANLMYAIADLLGPGVLIAFAAGRYHRPRAEERALLFIDLCGSTSKAERLGQERFMAFLDAYISDVSRDIVANGGEIHKYVGDEVIAIWRLAPGRSDAGIVRACFAARERLEARRGVYERAFGEGAEFRAALHAGVVAVGEIGLYKKEIALIGDPMNTAARILDACRELGYLTLASSTLIDRLNLPPDRIECAAIAALPLRGKTEPLDLVSLSPSRLVRDATVEALRETSA
jgi:adenylate cyclase